MPTKTTVRTLVQWEYPNGYRNDKGDWVPGTFHNPGTVERLSVDDVPDLEYLIANGTVEVVSDAPVSPYAPTPTEG